MQIYLTTYHPAVFYNMTVTFIHWTNSRLLQNWNFIIIITKA